MSYVPPAQRALYAEINNDRNYVNILFEKTYNLCTHAAGEPWNGERFIGQIFHPEAHIHRFEHGLDVPFQLEGSGDKNIWNSDLLQIDIAPVRVTSVHSLMNCFYGEAPSNIGSIEFIFEDGTTYAVEIIVGKNIRDYYQALRYTASITDNHYVTEVMSPSAPTWTRLDMQTWIFPEEFHGKCLCGIAVSSVGMKPIGKLFIAALTATTVDVQEEDVGAEVPAYDEALQKV